LAGDIIGFNAVVKHPPVRRCPDCRHHLNWTDDRVGCTGCQWWVVIILDGWLDLDSLSNSASERVSEALRESVEGDIIVID
jgi:hypothetical protein